MKALIATPNPTRSRHPSQVTAWPRNATERTGHAETERCPGPGVPEICQNYATRNLTPPHDPILRSASELGSCGGGCEVSQGVANHPRIDGKDGVAASFRRGLHTKAAAQAGSGTRPLRERRPPTAVCQRICQLERLGRGRAGWTSGAATHPRLPPAQPRLARAEGSVEMADPAVVPTDAGPVRGTVTDEYRLFQGIPYAASTAGELRWRPRNRCAHGPGPGRHQARSHVPPAAVLLRRGGQPGRGLPVPECDRPPGRRPATAKAGDGVDPR
jgi:Carboxylesterase family